MTFLNTVLTEQPLDPLKSEENFVVFEDVIVFFHFKSTVLTAKKVVNCLNKYATNVDCGNRTVH